MVISAPGRYAFPDPGVPWPNGMADARIRLEWGFPDPPVTLRFRHDPEGWAEAASLPITVVVGALDRSCVKDIPGNLGTDHIERGQAWVLAMNHHARHSGRVGRTVFALVASAGHTSAGDMRDAAAEDLFRVWGNDGDMPLAGDFNRDGDGDRAVFRPWAGTSTTTTTATATPPSRSGPVGATCRSPGTSMATALLRTSGSTGSRTARSTGTSAATPPLPCPITPGVRGRRAACPLCSRAPLVRTRSCSTVRGYGYPDRF